MSLNPASTQYSFRAQWGPVYVRNRGNTARAEVCLDGAIVAPEEGTYALYDPTGVLVVEDSVTVAADGAATFALTSTHLPSDAPLSALYQEVWTLTFGEGEDAVERVWDRAVAVAVRDWSPPISDADLTGAMPRLSQHLPQGTSTFQQWISEAWTQILGELEGMGIFPQQVMSPQRFRAWHRHLALALFYESCGLGGRALSNWQELANSERDRAEKARASCTSRMDRDEDGKPDDDGVLSAMGSGPVYLGAARLGVYPRASSSRWG